MKDLFSVKGKTVLVTGGSRGIGLMIARGFVENGAKVYITSRDAKVCAQACDELNKCVVDVIPARGLMRFGRLGPGTCEAIPADLQKLSEVERLVDEFSKKEKVLSA